MVVWVKSGYFHGVEVPLPYTFYTYICLFLGWWNINKLVHKNTLKPLLSRPVLNRHSVSNGKGPFGAVSSVAISLKVQRILTYHLATHLRLKSTLYAS